MKIFLPIFFGKTLTIFLINKKYIIKYSHFTFLRSPGCENSPKKKKKEKEKCQPLFPLAMYSQKAILKHKSAKIKCFLRFQVARI